MLAFDRAAAYPKVVPELRDSDFNFVAYERGPYPTLPDSAFTETFVLDGERIGAAEEHKNLGQGRSRVRRLALRLPGGHQVNTLTNSTADAFDVAAVMIGRWRQENAFHQGVQRWALSQLDGRRFTDFEPGAVIPGRCAGTLTASCNDSREAEGHLHRRMARATRDLVMARLTKEHAANLERQRRLEVRRRSVPQLRVNAWH